MRRPAYGEAPPKSGSIPVSHPRDGDWTGLSETFPVGAPTPAELQVNGIEATTS